MRDYNFELPREKLLRVGSLKDFSNVELLALILRTGSRRHDVFSLANYCLKKYSLRELSQRNLYELMDIEGISLAKASIILASFELSKRINEDFLSSKKKISSSKDIFDFISPFLSSLENEVVVIVLVDVRCRVLKFLKISEGGINFSFFNIQKLFKLALDFHAHGFFLVHNHPSGDPSPSQEDKSITKKVKSASDVMSVVFFDHIIIGGDSYFSFFDNDLL